MRSGGYSLSARVRQVTQRVLLLWGRHDEIVDPLFSKRYLEDLRDCRRASPLICNKVFFALNISFLCFRPDDLCS